MPDPDRNDNNNVVQFPTKRTDTELWQAAADHITDALDAFRAATDQAAADKARELMLQGPAVFTIRRGELEPAALKGAARTERHRLVTTLLRTFKEECGRAGSVRRIAGAEAAAERGRAAEAELTPNNVLGMIVRQQWPALAALRVVAGERFEQVTGGLRDQDEIGLGLELNGALVTVEWDEVAAGIDAAAAGVALDDRPEVNALLHELNQRFFMLNDGRATVAERDRDDENYPVYRYHTPPALKHLYLNRTVEVGKDSNGKPIIHKAADVWLTHPRRRTYMGGQVFDPRNRHRADQYNRWRGWGVQPVKGDWSKMRKHIRVVIAKGDPKVADYVIRWIARMFQYPWLVGEITLVLRGIEGSGKGKLNEWLLRITGEHGRQINDANHLTGRFNDHLFGLVFVFADEAFFAGDRAVLGKLKSLVTERDQLYEAKNRPVFRGKNTMHVLMASNNDWVVPAALDSRRWCVIDVSDAKKADWAYFAAIDQELANGGAEAMLYDLLRVDLSNFNVRDYPVTEALIEQRDISLSHELAWWKDVLSRGYVWASRCGRQDWFNQWHEEVATEMLYQSYEQFADKRRERHKLSREAFGRHMMKLGAQQKRLRDAVVGERGGGFSGELVKAPRPYGYALGTLDTAKADFTKLTGLPV
jgi:hypothetical protein